MFIPLEDFAFIPDFLNLSKLNTQNYFGLIISAVASIFGILMAVIIISVEFFKEKMNKNGYVNPLGNRNIQSTIHLSVNIIVIAFFSYITIDKFENSNTLTLGYYVAYLFILYIYSIYPFFTGVIDKSSKIKNVLENATSLNIKDFREFLMYSPNEKERIPKILLLKKDIDSYILENKESSYEAVNNAILKRGLNLIEENKDMQSRSEVVKVFIWLWTENAKMAIRANDSYYFDLIWNSIGEIYRFAAKKNIDLMNFQDIETFIFFDVKKLYLQFKNTFSLSNALNIIEASFKINLIKNCPKQEEIWDLMFLYERINYNSICVSSSDASVAWDRIVEIFKHIEIIQDIAIELGDQNLFMECNDKIGTICLDVLSNTNDIGSYQQGYLIKNALITSFYKSSIALEKEVFSNTMYCFDIPRYFMENAIKRELLIEKDVREIIMNLGEYLFIALKERKLDLGYSKGTFGEFTRIGLFCLRMYDKNIISEHTVNYFIEYFKYIKDFIEREGVYEFSEEYRITQRAVKDYIDVAIENCKFDKYELPVSKWVELYNSFKEINNLDKLVVIKWEIIEEDISEV